MVLSWKNLFADLFIYFLSLLLYLYFFLYILLHKTASGRHFYVRVVLPFLLYMHV